MDPSQNSVAMQKSMMKESLNLFNEMTQTCFIGCCKDFYDKELNEKEEACIDKCGKKFLAHQKRVGMRFAEINMSMMREQQQQQQQQQQQ